MEQEMDCCLEHHLHADALAAVREALPQVDELETLAEFYKVFGDPTRIRILYALDSAELCVCDLAQLLGVTPSAVSHQLKLLRQFRLVRSRRDGKTVYYSLADDHVRSIIDTGREHIEER